jgi:acyl carrier protein
VLEWKTDELFMDNLNQLKLVFSKLFNIEIESLNNTSSQDNIHNWDSMGTVILANELEQVFSVSFDFSEINDFKTFELVKAILVEKGIVF